MNSPVDPEFPIRETVAQERFYVAQTNIAPAVGEFWWDSDEWPTTDTYRFRGVFRIDAGKLIITQLRIDGSDWIAEADGHLRERRNEEVPQVDISVILDRQPLANLFRMVRVHFVQLRSWALENLEGADEASELIRSLGRLADAARSTMKSPGPKGHTETDLATQAEDCIAEAASDLLGAHQRLAEKWFCAPATARDRIRRLRAKRWLLPGESGRFTALPGPELDRWRTARAKERS
jgi:hypothetical protein